MSVRMLGTVGLPWDGRTFPEMYIGEKDLLTTVENIGIWLKNQAQMTSHFS